MAQGYFGEPIEGFMPFKGYKTYYRYFKSDKPTLICLHGGPGSTHNYFELLDELSREYSLLMYDQLGCGHSIVYRREDLWNKETWMEELNALIAHLDIQEYHLLGQSWGGMLALLHTLNGGHPKSLILSSTLSDASLWAHEQHRLISFMSYEDRLAIEEAEKSGHYDSPAYDKANETFMKLHCSDFSKETRECLIRPKKSGTEAYMTAWGPNEFMPLGNLKDYNVTARLKEIKVPTLIISGTNDLCTPLVAKTMNDGITGSRWVLFPDCRHTVFAEKTEEYIALLKEWLEAQ